MLLIYQIKPHNKSLPSIPISLTSNSNSNSNSRNINKEMLYNNMFVRAEKTKKCFNCNR